MKILLQNQTVRLAVDGADKKLIAAEHILAWNTLAEYSLQIETAGHRQMLEADSPEAEWVTDGRWVRRYAHPELEVEVAYALEDGVLLKTVTVTARQPLTLRYARLETAAVAEELTRGGEGQPLFVGEAGFIASTFPTAENCRDGGVLFLRHAPFVPLTAGESFAFPPAVFGVNLGGGLPDSFRQFLLPRRPHPADTLRVYCDWGAHDEMVNEDGFDLSAEMASRVLGDLRAAREKTGLTYDYYLMDAYWYALDSYDHFKPTHWPDGPEAFLRELEEMGMQFGLWFDVNLQKVLAPNKTLLRNGTADELCVADAANMRRVFSSVEKHIREHRVRMLKFDFAFFDCFDPEHAFHSRRPVACKEPAVRNFLTCLRALQAEFPDLQVLAYNGFTTKLDYIGSVDPNRTGWAISPFWALAIDYLYCGDPRPAEHPAPMEKSILHYTDCMLEQFTDALMPREAVDDHGSMIGTTNTIYYLHKRSLRDSYILNIVRGTRKIHLYGETALLDDGDWAFLAKAQELFTFVCAPDCVTDPVLERPSRCTVYGYANTRGDRGLVTAVNVTAACQPVVVNISGQLRWTRIYHAGEWCEESLAVTGGLDTTLEGYGVDMYRWERVGETETTPLPMPIAAHPVGGYVEADSFATVTVTLPENCRRVGIRFLSDTLSPLRAPNEERKELTITAEGATLTRLDTMTVWSGISFAVYAVTPTADRVSLQFANTGDDLFVLHWQDVTAGKEC